MIIFIYGNLGFTSDWDILYVDAIRNNIVGVTLLMSGIAMLLSAIPFLFYDLSEQKHGQIIEQLKQRMASKE